MSYSKGVMWLDDCRIPFLQDEGYNYKNGPLGNSFSVAQEPDGKRTEPVESNPLGRFTPNLLVCGDVLNDGSVSKTNNGKRHNKTTQMFYGKGEHHYTGDKGTNSRYYDLDLWFDKMLEKL